MKSLLKSDLGHLGGVTLTAVLAIVLGAATAAATVPVEVSDRPLRSGSPYVATLVSVEQAWEPGDEVGVVVGDIETVVRTGGHTTESFSSTQSALGNLISLNQEWDPGDRVAASAQAPAPAPAPAPAVQPEPQAPVAPDTAADLPAPVEEETYEATPALAVGSDIITTALAYVGYPYVWGASGPNAFDCSGFVQHVFGLHGISLPRVSGDQGRAGRVVSAEEAQAGDLVVWGNSHVAIYLGEGRIVHSATEDKGVEVSSLYGSYYFSRVG